MSDTRGALWQKIRKVARSNTDPLYILDTGFPLFGGHNESSPNGTATFVCRNEKIYVVTAAHVVEDGIEEAREKLPNPIPTLISQKFMQLGEVDPNNNANIRSSFRRPTPTWPAKDRPDIAITPLRENYWAHLQQTKQKTAIDLDAMREPRWSDVALCLAIGYPNEHKSRVGDKVAVPMLEVSADYQQNGGTISSTFTLHSQLKEEHGYFFSGMSGGPVYADDGTDDVIPIGIVYEGSPGSKAAWEARDSQSYLTGKDIVVNALVLTPSVFDDWLRRCDLT
ncbi:trypsin-like serine protease [Ralstonia pseudosolanacearum]|uniref:trypsin-like serine protease n=1 Tax=Ralstonia pseudosolanacearum TaxID=1310165 RepID=UPI003CEEEF07